MESYDVLANSYDAFGMDSFNAKMVDYAERILRRRRVRCRSVLDLACGTGSAAIEFARRGCSSAGMDISGKMLEIARRKARRSGLHVRFFRGDMRDFGLPVAVDLVTCFFDSVNHLLDKEQIISTFRCVNRVLRPGGLFIFDINTIRALQGWDGFTTIREATGVYSVWQGSFDSATQLAAIKMTFFHRQRDGGYLRSGVEIPERGFKLGDWKSMLRRSGFERIEAFKCFTFDKPARGTFRVCFVCRRK